MNHNTQDNNDLTQVNWLQELAKDYLKQQKRGRFFRFLFKVLIVGLVAAMLILGPPDKRQAKTEQPHVAVIELEGPIFTKTKADAEHFIKSLKKVYKNQQVKAIYIDINSPGGSPVQADEMYQALVAFRHKYPKVKVRAICSDICASAAYYVAAGADEIYANPASMVGSIGVIYNGFGFTDAMDKLGVSRRMITAGKYKGFLDPFSPEKPADKQKIQQMLDIVHQQFIDSVVKGRGQRLKINEDTFSGLIWTGQQAKAMGLVDGYGSIRTDYSQLPRVLYSSGDSLFERLNRQLGESFAGELLTRLGVATRGFS